MAISSQIVLTGDFGDIVVGPTAILDGVVGSTSPAASTTRIDVSGSMSTSGMSGSISGGMHGKINSTSLSGRIT